MPDNRLSRIVLGFADDARIRVDTRLPGRLLRRFIIHIRLDSLQHLAWILRRVWVLVFMIASHEKVCLQDRQVLTVAE